MPESVTKNWLKKRGKGQFLDFKDEQLEILKKIFKSLDTDCSGSIGHEELEDPLIALGLVDNHL
jgi:centrin-2